MRLFPRHASSLAYPEVSNKLPLIQSNYRMGMGNIQGRFQLVIAGLAETLRMYVVELDAVRRKCISICGGLVGEAMKLARVGNFQRN